MTESSCSKRDTDRLTAIVKFCEDIRYLIQLHGSDERDFRENNSLRSSCLFCMMQIGEYVKRLSSGLKSAHSEIDWRGAAGMVDIIANRCIDMNISRIRPVIMEKIPDLERKCRSILNGP